MRFMGVKLEDVRFDCSHFKGYMPCDPNKQHGVVCSDCSYYQPVSKRILIIKLGAIGDVIRTTPLINKYNALYGNCHFTWITQSPAVLPKESIHEILTPDAVALFQLQHQQFDIAMNLDKDAEACMLLASVNAAEKYGFTWEDNHIAPATPNATHKLMTGLFDALSQENTKSYLEEIFEICHLEFNYEEYLIRKNDGLVEKWAQASDIV